MMRYMLYLDLTKFSYPKQEPPNFYGLCSSPIKRRMRMDEYQQKLA